MRIRGEISYELKDWAERPDRPLDDTELPDAEHPLNPDLYSPDNAERLAAIRDHCMEHPEGVLLDVYQAVTELELKHPPGSVEGQQRYLSGLRNEVRELHHELLKAFVEHPHLKVVDLMEGPADMWMATALDPNRLRFADLSSARKEKYLGELGDVLWYTARFAAERDTSLSRGVVEFLRESHQPIGNLLAADRLGFGAEAELRAAERFDFRYVQDLALSQKAAYYERLEDGSGWSRKATIDSHPHLILNGIADGLYSEGAKQLAQPDRPYQDLPKPEVTVGQLVWFMAYTANSILNTDFAQVMKANLQKVTQRSERGTLFSKKDRGEADEASIFSHRHPRMPME